MIIDKTKTHSVVPEINPVDQEDLPKPSRPTPFTSKYFQSVDMLDSETALETGFHSGSSKRSGLRLALWTWFSATVDALVLVSLSCFFMVLFSFLMKTSPSSVVALFLKNQNLISILAMLFVVTVWSYLIFMRAFMGASIGEWACDLRLGEPVQRFRLSYLAKVVLRTTLIMISGIIVIPLLSVVFGRDLAGDISGLKIYSLQ